MKRLFSLLLALTLAGTLTLPALAAEEAQPAPLPAWSYDQLADAYAMGLCGDGIYTQHGRTVTVEEIEALCAVVSGKLALLEAPLRTAEDEPLVLDATRGGVVNALYQTLAAWEFPGVELGAAECLTDLQVLRGDEKGELHLDRPCTVLEAVTMANRLALGLYDRYNAGSLGLLWKAEGEGNTLYLLGSIHMDRDNVYPFHRQLRDILSTVELAAFELDFNDTQGIAEFTAMQVYSDGTTLKDHISPELFAGVVAALEPLGLTEELTAQYKPWALGNTFQSLAMMDESSGDTLMAVDLYCYSKAVNAGVAVAGVETYAFQGGLFDTLSPEYQEDYLASALALYLGEEAELTEEEQAAAEESLALMSGWMTNWKQRDIAAFEASYDKGSAAGSEDELTAKLFDQRDPNMAAWADGFLSQEGSHTGILVVGAGHMVGEGGIVRRLQELGYTVEAVPAP